MTLSRLDERLLREDCTAEITLESVATLSSPQLAIAAAREDLGILIRQRAYHAFLSRRAAFLESEKEACTANEIFSVAVSSTTLSLSDVDKATPTTLLLMPFDSQLRNEDLAQVAARRFRQLASEHQDRLKTEPPHSGDDRTWSQSSQSEPVTMHVVHGILESPSHDPLSADDLDLQADGGKLLIYQQGQLLGSVRASHIQRISYIAGEDDGRDRVDYSSVSTLNKSGCQTDSLSSHKAACCSPSACSTMPTRALCACDRRSRVGKSSSVPHLHRQQ